MFHIDVQLRDTRNNTITFHHDTYEYPGDGIDPEQSNFDGIIYYWTEGNFECDCNRSLLVPGEECECNMDDNIILLERITVRETGVVIFPEGKVAYPPIRVFNNVKLYSVTIDPVTGLATVAFTTDSSVNP